jgi:putative phosphoesterase
MTRIGLLSDTHGYLDDSLLPFLKDCDEIWHAGDFGSTDVYNQLISLEKPVRGVYGNIDGIELRNILPLQLKWKVEDVTIFMIHIGGYPGKYVSSVRKILIEQHPDIFVCGHSHILKVIFDPKLNLLHLNPGSCGKEGFHKVRTALSFVINGKKISDMAVIELGNK